MGYAEAVIADAPVGYWHLYEGSPVPDALGRTDRPLTASGVSISTGFAAGHPGGFAFVGGGFVEATGSWVDQAQFSVEVWFTSADNGSADYRCIAAATGTEREWTVYLRNGRIEVWTRMGIRYTSAATIAANTAYHLVITWDGATGRLYLNGALDGTFTGADLAGTANRITFGAWYNPGAGTRHYYLTGRLAEPALYGQALSAARVAEHWARRNDEIPTHEVFPGSALASGRWTQVGAITRSFLSNGLRSTSWAQGAALLTDKPLGSDFEVVIRAKQPTAQSAMIGPCAVDNTGFGAVAAFYAGALYVLGLNGYVYPNNGAANTAASIGAQPLPTTGYWLRLRRTNGTYYAGYSLNGRTWTESPGITRGDTPTRVGVANGWTGYTDSYDLYDVKPVPSNVGGPLNRAVAEETAQRLFRHPTYHAEVLKDGPAFYAVMSHDRLALTDLSGNSRHLTDPGGVVADGAGPGLLNLSSAPQSSLIFNGAATENLRGGSGTWLDTPTFTAEAWFKVSNLGLSHRAIVSRDGSQGWVLYARDHGGFQVTMNAAGFQTPGGLITVNKRHHVALTYDGGTIRVYLDGELVHSTASSYTPATGMTFRIGAAHAGSNTETDTLAFPFYGSMSHVAYYPTALSADKIRKHYRTGVGGYLGVAMEEAVAGRLRRLLIGTAETVETAGQLHRPAWAVTAANPNPVQKALADGAGGYWSFDETTGTVAADATGNGRNGTYGVGVVKGQPRISSGGTAAIGGTANYDSRVTVPHGTWLNTTGFTWMARIKPTAADLTGGVNHILAAQLKNGNFWPDRKWMFSIYQGKLYALLHRQTPDQETAVAGATALVAGQTYTVGMTYDGTTYKIFLNGVQDASYNFPGGLGPAALPLVMGTWQDGGAGDAFLGQMDEASWYPTALSADRMLAHHQEHASTAGVTKVLGQAVEEAVAGTISMGIVKPLRQAVEVAEALRFGRKLTLRQAVEVAVATRFRAVNPPDTFDGPWVIAGESGTYAHDMTNSTLDPAEPNLYGVTKTSWFEWTPPYGMTRARVHTRGSDGDTAIAVYQGDTLGALTLVASADAGDLKFDIPEVTDPNAETPPYRIQVGVHDGPATNIALNWMSGEPETYDSFSSPLLLESDYGRAELEVTNGTTEVGEPTPAGTAATSWAEWVAPSSLKTDLTVRGFDGLPFSVRVYTGNVLAGLTQVAEVSGGTGSQTVTLQPVAGQAYRIQVAAQDDLSPGYELSWYQVPVPVEPEPLPVPPGEDEPPEDPADPATMLTRGSAGRRVHLVVEVYREDGRTLISEVPRRLSSALSDALNVPGMGALRVPLEDPILEAYPDLLDFGHIVKFWLGGKCVLGFTIRERETSLVTSDEYGGFVIEVSGPSVQNLLGDFIVRHDGEPRPDSLESRYYSWASKKGEWYNDADWNAEVATWPWSAKKGSGEAASRKKVGKPKNWRVPDAFWMSIKKSSPHRYFRRHFTSQTDGLLVRIFCTADEDWRLYLDGEEIMAGDPVEVGYTEFKKFDTVLSRGPHMFAIYSRTIGYTKGGDYNDAVLFAMCELDLDGKIKKPALLVSDGTWKAYDGNPPPGWNRAQVLRNVIREAQDRLVESALRLNIGFGAEEDANGEKWPDVPFNQEVRIGTTGLDLQAQLSEGGGFDVWVRPDTLTVHAYRRRGTDKSASVTLEPGRNLLNWRVTDRDEVINTYLVKYDGGWTEQWAKGSQDDFGKREGFVSLENIKDPKSAKELLRRASDGIARAQIRAGTGETRKRAHGQPEGGLIGVKGAYPFIDFGIGDVVKAPNSRGKLVPMRVLGLSLVEDSEGNLSFDPDLEEIRNVG